MDRCLYCGQGIPLLTRMGGEHHYCSKEHKKAFQIEYEKRAVQALSRPAPPPDPADAGWAPEIAVAIDPGMVLRIGDLLAFSLIGEAWVPADIGEDGPPALSVATDTLAMDAGVSEMASAIHAWDSATAIAFAAEAGLPAPHWRAEMARLPIDGRFAPSVTLEALASTAHCMQSRTAVVAPMAPPPALPWARTSLTSGDWRTAGLLPLDQPVPVPVQLEWKDDALPAVPFAIASCIGAHLTPAPECLPAWAPLQPLACPAMNPHQIAGIAAALPVELAILRPRLAAVDICVLALADCQPVDWSLTATGNGANAKIAPRAEAEMAFVPPPRMPRCASGIASPWSVGIQEFPCPRPESCDPPAALLNRTLAPPPFRGPVEWDHFLAAELALGGDGVTALLGAPDWPRVRIPEKPSALPGVYGCGQAEWMPSTKTASETIGIYVPLAQGYPLRPRISCSATPV